jgi:hypothetical protein
MTLDLGKLVSADQIRGEDDEETLELQKMLKRARAYLLSQDWCEAVSDEHLGFGVGGVVAVFLLRAKLRTGGEELLWVIEGDLPSAYLVTDRARSASTALEIYADLMQDWVKAVRRGTGLRDVFPVDAPADEEHAALLEKRIELLRRDIIPAATRAT